MKALYYLALATGVGLLIYYYGFNFDNMSETELVNSVLYWYVPLVFGIYGLLAYRIKKRMPEEGGNVLKYAFSGKDSGLLITLILVIALSGIFGFILFIIPVLLLNVKSRSFDLSVAVIGTFLWLIALYLFFKVLWPSL